MSEGNTPAPAASAAPATEISSEASNQETQEQALDGQESSSEGSPQGEQAPKGEVKKAEAAAKQEGAKKVNEDTFKLKVDGKEFELSREEMVKYAQLGKAGQKRMQKAAEIEKQTIAFLEELKANPRKVLKDPALGVDVIKMAQEILAEQLEEEAKSPEQREKESLMKELEELRNKQKTDEETRKTSERERMYQEVAQDLEVKVIDALEKTGLPRKGAVLNKIADVMNVALENNIKISPLQAAQLAKEELMGDIKELFDVLDDEKLEQYMGETHVKRLRQAALKRVKSVPKLDTQAVSSRDSEGLPKPKLKLDWKSFVNPAYGKKK